MPIRVLLADDHVIVRQGFRTLLERDGFEVVAEASDGREAVRMTRQLRPDVVILDIYMPRLNGIDAAREILGTLPDTKTILLSMSADDHHVVGALKCGITGYLLKTRAVGDLEQAIREVLRGGVYLSSGISGEVVRACLAGGNHAPESLTPRERQVLQLVAEGKSTKEAAAVLGISVKTAESHRGRIMKKLDIHETAGLVRYAIRTGLVQP